MRLVTPRLLFWFTVLLTPFVGVLLLRAPLVNALPYRDPWFYSGYGWSLAHDINVFGWFYYAVRFPVILPIAWSTAAFGPVAGYIILRYIILASVGGLLYACTRMFASRTVACVGVALLTLNPFYMREVLWDYTSFITLPCTIGGAALWYLGSGPRSGRVRMMATTAGAGAFLGAAIYANAIAGLVLPALFGVEAVASLRCGWRGITRFAVRVAVALVGAALVFLGGYLGYCIYLGVLSPHELIRPTLEFLRSGNKLLAPFQRPVHEWIKGEPRIYGPVLVSLAIVVVVGRSIFRNTVRARIAQFAIAYTTIFWIYRFTMTSSLIETWWAYNMTAVTAAFGIPVILDEVTRRLKGSARLAAGGALVATGVTDLVIRSFSSTAIWCYNELRTHIFILALVLVASGACAVAVARLHSHAGRCTALVALCVLIAAITLTPAHYIGIDQTGEFSPDGKTELDGYQAAYDMNQLIAAKDTPEARVLLWSNLYGLADVGWTNLPNQMGGIENAEVPTPVPELNADELELLRYPTTSGVLVVSQSLNEVNSAAPALKQHGFDPRVERTGAWSDGKLHYALVMLGRVRD